LVNSTGSGEALGVGKVAQEACVYSRAKGELLMLQPMNQVTGATAVNFASIFFVAVTLFWSRVDLFNQEATISTYGNDYPWKHLISLGTYPFYLHRGSPPG
jgi:hypothetical protein